MRKIVIGTHNRHKTEEISRILSGLPLEILSLADFPDISPVEEDGKTLLENAVKKATHYSRLTGLTTIADDTGLEIEALNGEPGIRSARYAGEHCSYDDNNRKLLENLASLKNGGRENRNAVFRCVIALSDPSGTVETREGTVAGQILTSVQGRNGFGYDPVFYVPGLGKTLADLSMEEKNTISHRGIAVQKIKELLKTKCAGS